MTHLLNDDLAIKHEDGTHSYVKNYQRVFFLYMCFNRGEINLIQPHVAME